MAKRTRAPDPDRLVRDEPGRYHSEDGRFTVRSDAGGGWYVSDAERVSEFGLELVLGPLESLGAAREALVRQRAEPTGTDPTTIPPTPTDDVAAECPKPAGRRGRAPARAAKARRGSAPDAVPEPPPEREPEPVPAPRPAARVTLARHRATGDERDAVAATVRAITEAWTGGTPDALVEHLDPDIVLVLPHFEGRVVGAAPAVASFASFMTAAVVDRYRGSDLHVDVRGETGVATLRFELDWEQDGERHLDAGHELWVLRRDRDRWLAVWRTLILDAEG